MRSTPWIIAAALGFTALLPSAGIAASSVDLYLFWGDGCPHCRAEKEALPAIQAKFPQVRIHEFEIYNDQENVQRMIQVGETLGIDVGGVPLTVIGDRPYVGFSAPLSAQQFAARIEECTQEQCPDSLAAFLTPGASPPESAIETTDTAPTDTAPTDTAPTRYTLPLLGQFDARTVSLPMLAVVMGLLDGFNPCALWTLLFLLSLLVGIPSRARRWTLGATFIVASAAVYFFFMTAWLKLILFLGFILWVRLGIGAIALIGGGYSIKQGLQTESGCIVEGDAQRKRVFQRLRTIVLKQNYLLALAGIITLAFAVNLVELVCSAGLPAIFTQVLALNSLPAWQSYALIGLYILFFMLDDLIVFFVTMMTLELTGITTKYTRVSHLVGGALMVAIGILLIFKPEWLLFG